MIIIYSKKFCPYCVQAKHLLNVSGIAFTEVNVEEVPEAKEFLISEGHRTVPQLYKDGKLLVEGGYMGLASQDEEFFNKLKEEQCP